MNDLIVERLREVRKSAEMLDAIEELFDSTFRHSFIKGFDDDRLIDYALFMLDKSLEKQICNYSVNEVIEKILENYGD